MYRIRTMLALLGLTALLGAGFSAAALYWTGQPQTQTLQPQHATSQTDELASAVGVTTSQSRQQC